MKCNRKVSWEGEGRVSVDGGIQGGRTIMLVTIVGGCWHLFRLLADSSVVSVTEAHYPTAYCILTVRRGDFNTSSALSLTLPLFMFCPLFSSFWSPSPLRSWHIKEPSQWACLVWIKTIERHNTKKRYNSSFITCLLSSTKVILHLTFASHDSLMWLRTARVLLTSFTYFSWRAIDPLCFPSLFTVMTACCHSPSLDLSQSHRPLRQLQPMGYWFTAFVTSRMRFRTAGSESLQDHSRGKAIKIYFYI